ncbi:MAG: HAD family hydrolase [Betaproteobacteria bacterium]
MTARPKAILLDALGTLIGLEPPTPRLQAGLHARGYDVSAEQAKRAIRAEIRYYRAHLDEGRDTESLQDLRERCAAAMEPELPGVPRAVILEALLAALRFFAYPDAVPALTALRASGIRLVVVSNWDFSLHERLSETGLTPLLDGAIASAEVGAAKPDPAIFARALELAGTTSAWHVGDTPEVDLDGAQATGLPGILLDRTGAAPGALKTLLELIPLISGERGG